MKTDNTFKTIDDGDFIKLLCLFSGVLTKVAIERRIPPGWMFGGHKKGPIAKEARKAVFRELRNRVKQDGTRLHFDDPQAPGAPLSLNRCGQLMGCDHTTFLRY